MGAGKKCFCLKIEKREWEEREAANQRRTHLFKEVTSQIGHDWVSIIRQVFRYFSNICRMKFWTIETYE